MVSVPRSRPWTKKESLFSSDTLTMDRLKIFKSVMLAFFLLLSSCTNNGFKTEMSEDSPQSQTCVPENVQKGLRPAITYKSIYQKTQRKVAFKEDRPSLPFAEGFELSVLVDRQCLLKRSSYSILTQSLRNLSKKDFTKFSSLEAYTVSLPYSLSQKKIESIADKDPCVVGVTEERYAEPQSQVIDDPLFEDQAHLRSTRFADLVSLDSSPFPRLRGLYTIAVIDTGFDLEHEDLKNNYWMNPSEIPNNGVDDDLNGVIDDVHGSNQNEVPASGDPTSTNYAFHGTHVAGLLGAITNNTKGTSSFFGNNVRIMGINAWPKYYVPGYGGGDGAPPLSVVDRAIRYAVDNGADVINISMQTPDQHPNIDAAMKYAVSKNVVVVVAAGNHAKELGYGNQQHSGAPSIYTRDIQGAISVAATDSSGGVINPGLCSFSNYSGDYVEIGAPGCEAGGGLLSSLPTNRYGRQAGTSMSSPLGAAAAAFTISLMKEIVGVSPSAALIEEIILQGATSNLNLIGKTKNSAHLDLLGIYEYIENTYKKESPPECKTEAPEGRANSEGAFHFDSLTLRESLKVFH